MKIQIALASSTYVVKLPKGAKITGYEVHHPDTNKLLGRGDARTMKQVLTQMERFVLLGMTVAVTTIAQADGEEVKVKELYTVKRGGPVKVNMGTAAALKIDEEMREVAKRAGIPDRAINSGSFTTENKTRSLSLKMEGKKLTGFAQLQIARDDMASIYAVEAPANAEALAALLKWYKQRTANIPPYAISSGESTYRQTPL